MYRGTVAGWVAWLMCLGSAFASGLEPESRLGLFQDQTDVGSVVPAGTATYDRAAGRYTLTAAGANTWYHVDAFHYLWLKTAGDWVLTAEVTFPARTYAREPNPHRKGVLMFRQSLDPGSMYAALALHGSGLTALQYRHARGANTEDIEINDENLQSLRIEKRGDTLTAYVSNHGEPHHPVGASTRLPLTGSYYVGLGALSHEPELTDSVQFSHVALSRPAAVRADRPTTYSTLEVIQTEDQFRRATAVRSSPRVMSAVAWNDVSRPVLLQEAGELQQVLYHEAPAQPEARPWVPGALKDCPAHFGAAPDGLSVAVTCASGPGKYQIYLLPVAGGAARQITRGEQSSFFHAWSADGRAIAFTRGNGPSRADIYTVPVDGGHESRLTTDAINDGPDFSPDGRFLYFDSSRSGTTQIWRMHADGSAAEQITDDERENSSPHLSPDGQSLAFLSRPAGAGDTIGDAAIKVMQLGDGLIRTLVEFQGNRDSLAMQTWGDRNHLAFISYHPGS